MKSGTRHDLAAFEAGSCIPSSQRVRGVAKAKIVLFRVDNKGASNCILGWKEVDNLQRMNNVRNHFISDECKSTIVTIDAWSCSHQVVLNYDVDECYSLLIRLIIDEGESCHPRYRRVKWSKGT
jgi:hypothetical protein